MLFLSIFARKQQFPGKSWIFLEFSRRFPALNHWTPNLVQKRGRGTCQMLFLSIFAKNRDFQVNPGFSWNFPDVFQHLTIEHQILCKTRVGRHVRCFSYQYLQKTSISWQFIWKSWIFLELSSRFPALDHCNTKFPAKKGWGDMLDTFYVDIFKKQRFPVKSWILQDFSRRVPALLNAYFKNSSTGCERACFVDTKSVITPKTIF